MHWDPCDRSVIPCIEISSPKYLRQTPLHPHRLPTDAGLKEFSQTFIRNLSPLNAKISIVTRKRRRDGKIFVGMSLF